MMEHIKWKYPEAIVTCEWLKHRLVDNNIRIFDCTTYLHYTDEDPLKPYDVESGLKKYKEGHIPNAAFCDLQRQLSNNESPFNFTIPDHNTLTKNFQAMGVGDPFHIILYSTNAVQWTTRVWWLIFILGFKKVSILDGGLKYDGIFVDGQPNFHIINYTELSLNTVPDMTNAWKPDPMLDRPVYTLNKYNLGLGIRLVLSN